MGALWLSVFSLITWIIVQEYHLTPLVIFVLCASMALLELTYITDHHEVITFVTPSLLLTTFLFLSQNILVGWIYYDCWHFLLAPCLLYLFLSLMIGRLYLATHSRQQAF